MLKTALIVGGAGAAGSWLTNRYGAQLATQAAKLHVPANIAGMLIVGGFTAVSYFIAEKVL